MGYVSALRSEARGLRSDGRGRILFAIAAGWFLSIGTRMIYPVLLPNLRTAYGLDLTSAGLLLTVLFIAYGLGQFPGGILSDRFGERPVLVASTAISVATILLIVTARSTVVLFVVTALFGVGVALYAVARYTILAGIYPEQVGAANGVTSAAADAGQSVLPPIAGAIVAVFAWQYGFGFAIPLFIVVAVLLWVVVPASTPADSKTERSPLETATAVLRELRSPPVVYGTGLLLLGVSIWQAFTGFYPTYLIEVKSMSGTVAGGLFGLFFALGVVVQPLSGAAYDRIGIKRTLLFVMGISGVALVALPLLEGFWPLVGVTILLSAMLGFATVTQTHLIVALPETVQGTGFGVLRTISFTIGAASPVFVGAAADRGFFDEAFWVLAALAGLAILLSAATPTATSDR